MVDTLRDTVVIYRDLVAAHRTAIDRLNVYPVPDGDTGTNMARTLDAVVAEMEAAPGELVPTCDAISHGSLMGARGNSGVILSQVLRGIAATLKGRTDLDGAAFADALAAASTAAYQAVLTPVEGTILTVVRESADGGAPGGRRRGRRWPSVVRAARDAGRVSLARTPELLPVLADAGVVDAGGAGFLLLLDAALHVVDGEPLPEPPPEQAGAVVAVVHEPRRRQRAALRGDVLLRPRRRAHRGAQAGLGSDRRLHRRRRRRRAVELPRAHQRHRCGDRGGARPRRPAPPDPRHRPVRGGRHRARRARGGDDVGSGRAACRHLRRRRRQQRARHQRAVRRARRAGRRHRRADAEPVDGRAAGGRRAGQRRPRRRAAGQQEHHPRRRATRRPHPADGARRADPVDARRVSPR